MLKILLVDDEPLFREGVVQTVDWSACGAGIPDEAINGREALALMAHEAYDYVITDMIMPEMNGLEFLQEATRRFPAVNYIVLSGYDDFLLVKEAFHLGVVDYILKSEFDHQQLMSVIEKQRHIRTQVDSYHTTSGPGDVNLFYMKQGYLRNNWKEYEDIDTVCIQNLGIPLSTDDGLLYTSALRFHFTVETVQREDFRELREQMIHTIDRCVMETSEFLSFDRDGTCYLFYLSSTVLSWRDLSAIWEDMHRRLYAVLEDSVHALSLGFAMHGTTLQHVHSATEEAAYFLSFYHVGGVGKIYSEPKVQTLRKSTACQIPSLLGLVKGLYHLQYAQVADHLEQLTLDLSCIRGHEPEQIITHYQNMFILCSSFIESEGALSGGEFADKVHEYRVLEIAGADVSALNIWIVQMAQILRCCQDHSSRIFLRVQDFVCKHYMHDISLETVAQELQMNPSYLSRVLTKDSGIGFSSYLTNLRIEKAIELMTGSSLKLYEIAEAVGFNSSETFSRAFKRVKQVSPQSYLKKVK